MKFNEGDIIQQIHAWNHPEECHEAKGCDLREEGCQTDATHVMFTPNEDQECMRFCGVCWDIVMEAADRYGTDLRRLL